MTTPQPLSRLRTVGRISVGFLLDLVRLGRMDRDLLDALILIAIVQANVAPVARDADLSRAYGDYDALPPDDMRRRVSVSAVAHSLRQPYETVRRRVAALAAEGACAVTPAGVYVPGDTLHTPAHRQMVLETYELIRTLYVRLRALDALPDLPRPELADGAVPADGAPVRAAVRLSSDYVLRIVDFMTQHVGDLITGLTLLTILRGNVEHFPDILNPEQEGGVESFAPDALRRPMRISSVSERLGVPEETVRRHATRLVAQGYCVRTPEGFVTPAAVLARPRFIQLMGENHANLRRMFEGLARLGILAAWDGARPGGV
ncbi:hypothetical protein [Phenylobacterium sp.]|jgi:dienelactone hydrolase|uniref:hypothetical protein n=1 Tax=Phenylobacterium sp. TaxID=1871053 RepID=UPI002F9417D8